ncbi:histidine kinase [Lentzea sp. NPDC051838]|uniref:sensor histidine kinase n=1 Tax=Lentzea sp. NPDC051838 TaxID=3154849 RepID=UPI003417B09A
MRNVRLSAVLTELLFAGCVAAVTVQLIDLMPAWGWPDVLDPVPHVAVTGAAVLLVLARRVPVPTLLVAALLFGAFPATGVAFAAITHSAGGRIGTTAQRWIALSAAAVVPIGVVLLVQPSHQWRYVVVVMAIATVLCVALPALVGLSQTQQTRLVTVMRDRAESEARLRERSRIAGEMHDHLGHRLSLIAMFSGALETAAKGKDPKLLDAASHVRTAARGALDELRQSLGTLWSPDVPDAHNTTGTRDDIAQLVASSRAAGITVTLDWRGDDLSDAPSALRHAVHRVVREALTNVHKHAAAAAVSVTVEHEEGQLSVWVRNGYAQTATDRLPGNGHGLVGLRERVGLLGGTLSAGPAPDGGFAVVATMPLRGGRPKVVPTPQPVPPPRLTTRLASGLLGVGGLVAVAAMLLMTLILGAPLLPPIDDESLLDGAELGTTSAQVEAVYGPHSAAAQKAAAGVEPPVPPDSKCAYVEGAKTEETQIVLVYRFCYAADRLVDKVWISTDGQVS